VDEQEITVVIMIRKDNIPHVSCSVPARIRVATEDGELYAEFAASDLVAMAAAGMAATALVPKDKR
jgi:hypothetical protein